MKNLTLTFAQRLKSTDILGKITGTLDKIVALSAAYEAIRFTEDEVRQIKVKDLGNGMQAYEPPSAGFALLSVQLEDAHAAAFLKELDGYAGFTVADLGWLTDLKKQLNGDK